MAIYVQMSNPNHDFRDLSAIIVLWKWMGIFPKRQNGSDITGSRVFCVMFFFCKFPIWLKFYIIHLRN